MENFMVNINTKNNILMLLNKRAIFLFALILCCTNNAMKEKQRKVNCTDDSDSIYIKELIVPLEGNKIIECIDLEKETDIMTQLPLKEKIEEDLEIKKLPYILARLVTKHGRSYYKQYVDAEGLHQYLYRT